MRLAILFFIVGFAASSSCVRTTLPSAVMETPASFSPQGESSRNRLAIRLIKKELEVKNFICVEDIELQETRNPVMLKYICKYRERQPEYAQIWIYEAKGRVNLKTLNASLDDLEHTYAYQDPGEFSCADE